MLSRAERRAFFEEGFLIRRDVFERHEVEEMREAFDRLERQAYRVGRTAFFRGSRFVLGSTDRGVPRIDRIVWCGAAEPRLSDYGRDPRLLALAGELLGSRRMNQLINQAHFKFPGDGVEFPWHQDSTHRRWGRGQWTDVNGRGSYVQTVLALDDMTAENGPIEIIPGSCRLGHVEPGRGRAELPDELDANRAVTAVMAAGSVLLFGPLTFHRSLPNRSARPRRAFINGFAYPGANSRDYPGEGAGRLVAVPAA